MLVPDLSPDWAHFADLLDPLPDPYINDPVGWINNVLGEETWSKQEEIARSVASQDRVAVKAGHSVGKTWLCPRLVLWFVSVHPVGTATVITTAPTDDQVKTVMWQDYERPRGGWVAGQDHARRQVAHGSERQAARRLRP